MRSMKTRKMKRKKNTKRGRSKKKAITRTMSLTMWKKRKSSCNLILHSNTSMYLKLEMRTHITIWQIILIIVLLLNKFFHQKKQIDF